MNVSIGAALRQAREARRLTLAQVSEATKVRPHYLEALENDDLSAMPSAAQARGFLRIYAQFLEIDVNALIPSTPPEPEPSPSPAAPATKPPAESPRPGLFAQIRERLAARDDAKDPDSPDSPGEEPEQREPHTTPETESKKKASK